MRDRKPIRTFTELDAWQRARELHAAISEAVRQPAFRRHIRLSEQIRASALSAMANIAEGFERGSRRQFHQSLCIAKGEAGETLSHLFAALDARAIDSEQFESLRTLTTRTCQLIGALRRSVDPTRPR